MAGGAWLAGMGTQAQSLTSGHNTLTFPSGGVDIHSTTGTMLDGTVAFPVHLYVCQGTAVNSSAPTGTCPAANENSEPTAANTVLAAYSSVVQNSSTQVTATATLTTANGSAYSVSDVYVPSGTNMFTVTRTISVTSAGTGADTGFNSQFFLGFSGTPQDISVYHFMAPAMLYDQNQSAPAGAIATSLSNTNTNWFYWRETRAGMPMVMMQDPGTGSVLAVGRLGAPGNHGPIISSGANELSGNWIVDPSVQYGSVGIYKAAVAGQPAPRPTVGMMYPAAEGDVTYLAGGNNEWSWRSHPVYVGFSAAYVVTFGLEQYTTGGTGSDISDFPTALGATYHAYYNFLSPPIAADHSAPVFQAGINLAKTLYTTNQGNGNGKMYPGLPFVENVDGTVAKFSYKMGYDGTHLPLGFQLLRDGVLNADSAAKADGLAMLNFWATQDPIIMATHGDNLPMTWFEPNRSTQWSNVNCTSGGRPVAIREVSDGMEKMVESAIYARTHSAVGGQTMWESFATQYATWLLNHQDTSGTPTKGSFMRAYNPATGTACAGGGTLDATSLNNTTFPIRFLVEMWFATNNASYLTAARAAGAYAWTNIYQPMVFTGGIIARNNEDRESGAQALHAALALYDAEYYENPNSAATAQWLKAAQIAGNYVETYQYVVNMAITDTTSNNAFAAYVYAGTRATSISGVGGSTGDIYLSNEAFDFFRLHLLGDDANHHYLKMAEELEYNTMLTTQLAAHGQNFGYEYDGFVTEAVTLANLNFTTGTPLPWLTWVTNVELDSQQRLEDAFGNASIVTLAGENLTTLQTKNHQIYPAPGTIGWGN